MNWQKFILTTIFLSISSAVCFSQTGGKIKIAPISSDSKANIVKSSPAYAEVLLRKTEREAELEELLVGYTEDFPKVKELRFELGSIQKELDKILAVGAADAGKLTLALGKLIVRKTELETDLWNLRRQYNDDHPEVKRAKRKIEIYDKSISEIL